MALKILHPALTYCIYHQHRVGFLPVHFSFVFLIDFELSRNGSFEGCVCHHFGSVFRYGVYIYFNQSIERLGVRVKQEGALFIAVISLTGLAL